jgi:hypothetical protein
VRTSLWRRFVSRRHLRSTGNARLPIALQAFGLLCSGSSMAEALAGRFQCAWPVAAIRSEAILHPPGVLCGKCACSFLPLRSALREWSSMLLAHLSSGGGSVRCRAHADACYRTNRERGKNDGYVPSEAANRQLLPGRSRARRGRRSSRSNQWCSSDARATRLSKSRGS